MAQISRETLKQEGQYTPCYCEENIYHLIKTLHIKEQIPLEELQVIFVSNAEKRVPFWHQSSSHRTDGLVIWDYHVFLVQPSAALLWDLDTSLPCPVNLHLYIRQALRPDHIPMLSSSPRLYTQIWRSAGKGVV